MLKPGTVIRIFDRYVDPAKTKLHICICPARRLFLRINSRDVWPPSHRLDHEPSRAFLAWVSYVELRQLYRFDPASLRSAMALQENPRGRLSRDEASELAWSASRAPTLSDEYRDLIRRRLMTEWSDG